MATPGKLSERLSRFCDMLIHQEACRQFVPEVEAMEQALEQFAVNFEQNAVTYEGHAIAWEQALPDVARQSTSSAKTFRRWAQQARAALATPDAPGGDANAMLDRELIGRAAEYVERFAELNNEPADGDCREVLAEMRKRGT